MLRRIPCPFPMISKNARVVLITGANGQDARLISSQHRNENDQVVLTSRRKESCGTHKDLKTLLYDPMVDRNGSRLHSLLDELKPSIIYHLASSNQSSEGVGQNVATLYQSNIMFTENILRTALERLPNCKVLVAGSCHQFSTAIGKTTGISAESAQSPRNIYGLTKSVNHLQVSHYRRLGLWASFAILFNHESELRDESFLLPKICMQVARLLISRKSKEPVEIAPLRLNDPYAFVNWTSARNIAEALHAISNRVEPQDYVLGAERLTSISEVVAHLSGLYDVPISEIIEKITDIKPKPEAPYGAYPADARETWHSLGIKPDSVFKLCQDITMAYYAKISMAPEQVCEQLS